jgi:hypothetical protein
MPLYLFKHPEKNEYREVVFKMNEDKRFVDEDGIEWERRFTVPNASVDSLSDVDPFNIREAVTKTGNKKGSVGDLWDFSRELSERREEKIGHEDPVKRKMFQSYEEKNKVKHFYDKPSKIDAGPATIDFTKKPDKFKEILPPGN